MRIWLPRSGADSSRPKLGTGSALALWLSILGAAALAGTATCAKVSTGQPATTVMPDAAGFVDTGAPPRGGSGGIFGGGSGGAFVGTSDAATGPTEDANCGLVPFVLDRAPAPVLLVQDRSTSMRGTVKIGTGTRWENLRTAVTQVVAQTEANVYWGLKFFPNSLPCQISVGPEIAPKLMNAAPIIAALNAIPGDALGTGLTDGTPTRKVLEDAGNYLRNLPGSSVNKYIVLATDGQPTCANDSTTADDTVAALAAGQAVAAAGIKIAVIGIAFNPVAAGAVLPAEQVFLNTMADIGGMPRIDPADPQTRYYPAQNTDQLVASFTAITAQVFTCTFLLPKQPPSKDDVAVKIDGVRIPHEATNGWEYDAGLTSVTLHGSSCDQIKNNVGVLDVKIILGCPGVVIP